MLSLVACGGGWWTNERSNPPAVIKQGLFDVNLIEGLRYQSGSQSGVTSATGAFSYEQNQNIVFSVGDIVVGEVPARSRMSIINLVLNAVDETDQTVINIARFLLTIDDDANPANGIQINTTISAQAIGTVIDFKQSSIAFETNQMIKTIIQNLTAVSMAGTRTLVTSMVAQQIVRNNLLAAYAGFYDGTYSGDDTGSWTMVVDANGVITGDGISAVDVNFTIAGQTNSSGSVPFAQGGTSNGASFTGTFTLSGTLDGRWSNTTVVPAESVFLLVKK